ncbi:MAG TPA: MotA/TolQ/ExbB proton channel family protein [Candidatus Hydrogenedentes bacterium]|nr:MotA/TolQ/ExbB proton channel family protein [Candidatus Hydrogenedentota bacterium]HOS01935.1 MotA/TolQ/ExbB proton channel family protein [Candidatus Hydrogenedentota bacterium]
MGQPETALIMTHAMAVSRPGRRRWGRSYCLAAAFFLLASPEFAFAQTPEPSASASPAASDVVRAPLDAMLQPLSPPRQMTTYDMVQAGGAMLWVIMAVSILTLVMVIYCFLTVTPAREAPPLFVKRAHALIEAGDLRGAHELCEGRDEMLAKVLRAGLKMAGHDRYVIQEAMESEGERGAAALWQRISYINNAGVIAPLLGLLGTVWGMMRAFGSIAYDDSHVKTIEVASGVAQAMVTTAAGLLVAIPAMVAYYYLRGRVIRVLGVTEDHATELIELLARNAKP